MGDVVWLFDGPYGSEPDREKLLAAVEFLRAELARLDEEEPEDMESEAYEQWGDRHEELEDRLDDLMDQLDELDE